MGIIYSICRGISYLHMELTGTQGKPSIAHRDIKSNNILVKNDRTCCIADFGLAIVKDPSHPTLYKPEDIKQGTKRYMSPEILSETINSYNFESFLRSDMYSFGLVLWEICRRCDKGNGRFVCVVCLHTASLCSFTTLSVSFDIANIVSFSFADILYLKFNYSVKIFSQMCQHY